MGRILKRVFAARTESTFCQEYEPLSRRSFTVQCIGWENMRLLNANTLEIEDYYGDIPPYAILSHTWEEQEVSYQEFTGETAASLKGYKKITGCCKRALSDGIEYVWIDTCCIDKRSSSELSEAINSMFQWYRDSAICYAYLQDVDINEDPTAFPSSFRRSRWFKRGWTLQELIAPSVILFYASEWASIGTRDQLKETIAEITKIDRQFFSYGKLSDYSIAQKFSWASGRRTTRIEDEAYCLLGIFGVSMPLLYGEGGRAFARLQEELMRESDDQSIFAWSGAASDVEEVSYTSISSTTGLLAPSPAEFAKSGEIIRCDDDTKSPPFSITNRGIQITLPVLHDHTIPYVPFGGNTYGIASGITFNLSLIGTLAILNCRSSKNLNSRIAIVVEQSQAGARYSRYSRTNHALGLIDIRLSDIEQFARQPQDLLIQAREVNQEGIFWSSQNREKLVILKGLTSRDWEQYTLGQSEVQTHRQGNGNMTLRMPGSFLVRKQNVLFKFNEDKEEAFSLVLKWHEGSSYVESKVIAVDLSIKRSILERIKPIFSEKEQKHDLTANYDNIKAGPDDDIRMGLDFMIFPHATMIYLPSLNVAKSLMREVDLMIRTWDNFKTSLNISEAT